MTTVATLTLSSSVGRWCDAHPSRLQTLRITIFLQRVCVILACVGWNFVVGDDFLGDGFFTVAHQKHQSEKLNHGAILGENWRVKAAVMMGVMILGVGERLSAVGNMMVMERDWVCVDILCAVVVCVVAKVAWSGSDVSYEHIEAITCGVERCDASDRSPLQACCPYFYIPACLVGREYPRYDFPNCWYELHIDGHRMVCCKASVDGV